MKHSYRILALAIGCGLLLSSTGLAQEDKAGKPAKSVEEQIKELTGKVDKLTKEVAKLKSAKPKARQNPALAMLGKKAPPVELASFDGKPLTIGGKRDKPQVVYCYASWCPYCKKSLPWMESLHNAVKDKGVEVIAVNMDARNETKRGQTEDQSKKLYTDLNLTLPMTMTTAAGNDTGKVSKGYGARSFPTLFVVGQSGNVEAVHVGAKAGLDKIVEAEVNLLLQGKTRADFPK